MRQLEIENLNLNFKLSDLAAKLEAVLFMSPDGLSEKILLEVLGASEAELRGALNELDWVLEYNNHGIKLKFIANGWVLETEPNFYEVLERLQAVKAEAAKKRVQLRRAAVEVLAIVAYNQPVTRSEIEELRGTRCEGILSRLLNYGLIKISGRKGKAKAEGQKDNADGQRTSRGALVYRTTDRFLELFGLENISSLPSLDEIEEELIDLEPENLAAESESINELEVGNENENEDKGGDD
ncbi:MAG: SMC-Scp complex subunit ScpB [Synergistaceae bacterium]|nr:SMC-Scp complex subunit ScpB [Synergistaceae bacterium]